MISGQRYLRADGSIGLTPLGKVAVAKTCAPLVNVQLGRCDTLAQVPLWCRVPDDASVWQTIRVLNGQGGAYGEHFIGVSIGQDGTQVTDFVPEACTCFSCSGTVPGVATVTIAGSGLCSNPVSPSSWQYFPDQTSITMTGSLNGTYDCRYAGDCLWYTDVASIVQGFSKMRIGVSRRLLGGDYRADFSATVYNGTWPASGMWSGIANTVTSAARTGLTSPCVLPLGFSLPVIDCQNLSAIYLPVTGGTVAVEFS